MTTDAPSPGVALFGGVEGGGVFARLLLLGKFGANVCAPCQHLLAQKLRGLHPGLDAVFELDAADCQRSSIIHVQHIIIVYLGFITF